ncbi:serine/threonine-protein kinase [Streptomyces sp. NPDC057910]|uniref:serine/threonine-protein kinase n=1 Tax=Streptomyces sp. NPDC057910 TaxID=3346278 RepID=UPI0036F0CC2E
MKKDDVLGGRYRLLDRLGSGGMGVVWQGEDLRDAGRPVAVKCLRAVGELLVSLEGDDAHAELTRIRGRFRREGALLGRLRHRGIPELYGQGTFDGEPYLVMRLVEGMALHTFLDRCTPTVEVAAAIGVQIAEALAHAHDLPVVHRDLKPYNLIIDGDGVVVLIDFGIAKPLWPGVTDYTQSGSTVGSRGYEAPEQILERQITPKADLYALGCILYHLLTGHPPFYGERLRDQHVHDVPIPPTCHIGHIPDELEALVLKLLAKEPQDRPADARAVAEILRQFAPGPGDAAPSPRLEPDPTRPLRLPDAYAAQVEPVAPKVAPRSNRGHREAGFLSRRMFQELTGWAAAETDSGEPASAVGKLSELLPTARRSWGAFDPQVRAALRVAANGMRIAGRCQEAITLYEALAAVPAGGVHPDDLADHLEGVLGAAECRIPFGDLLPAVAARAKVLEALPCVAGARAVLLAEWCRELGTELEELRFEAEGQQEMQKQLEKEGD